MTRTGEANIYTARETQKIILEAAVTEGIDDAAPMKLVILGNAMAQVEYEANVDVPIVMTDSENTQSRNEWRTYRERNAQLTKHRGQGFSLIIGQCTKFLQDKMKQDAEWNVVRTSYDPLTLCRLIEYTVLGQTGINTLSQQCTTKKLVFMHSGKTIYPTHSGTSVSIQMWTSQKQLE